MIFLRLTLKSRYPFALAWLGFRTMKHGISLGSKGSWSSSESTFCSTFNTWPLYPTPPPSRRYTRMYGWTVAMSICLISFNLGSFKWSSLGQGFIPLSLKKSYMNVFLHVCNILCTDAYDREQINQQVEKWDVSVCSTGSETLHNRLVYACRSSLKNSSAVASSDYACVEAGMVGCQYPTSQKSDQKSIWSHLD